MKPSAREAFRQSVSAPPQSGDSGPDWSLTFADTMSLLMGFFVLLISFSTFDETQFKSVAGGVQETFGGDDPPEKRPHPATTLAGRPGDAPLPMPAPESDDALRGSVEAWSRETQGAVAIRPFSTYRGLELRLPADRVFVPGSDALTPHAEGLVQFVAQSMRGVAARRRLVLEVPVDTAAAPRAPQFEDAWHLAIARGVALRQALARDARVPAHRVIPAAVGQAAGSPGTDVTFVFEQPEVRPR
jgi:flagellar motor protein MotB